MGESTAERVRLNATVTGTVQGVGFRYWVSQQAQQLNLAGSAVNRFDGSVSIVAEGETDDVDALMALLHSGQTPGRVDAVDADTQPASGELTGFTVG